jgi:purine-binding chemotaxis protein CheW
MFASSFKQFVTFSLMGEEYAVEIEHIREVIEYEWLTRIPNMPAVVRGVFNLRGSVVPIIDLPLKFGQGETPLGPGTYVIVFDLMWTGDSVRLGLLTRELGQVVDIFPTEVKAVPDFGTRIRSEYLQGIARIESRFVLLLDVNRLLSPQELLEITSFREEDLPGQALEPARGPDQ